MIEIEIVDAEIQLINSVLVRIKYLMNVDRLRQVRVHRPRRRDW